ncbi:MAG: hypothetical protein PHR16_02100 [Methylovulum sp.]|nr:hypothetical protein [Methylovulum sp.]
MKVWQNTDNCEIKDAAFQRIIDIVKPTLSQEQGADGLPYWRVSHYFSKLCWINNTKALQTESGIPLSNSG